MARSSGTYNFSPSIAEFGRTAFRRLQIRGPAFEQEHFVDLRMAANLVCMDLSNRGVNLWAAGDEVYSIALQPGVSTYTLPPETVDLLDCYLREFTMGTAISQLGNYVLNQWGLPLTDDSGVPFIQENPIFTDPQMNPILDPDGQPQMAHRLGVFSTVKGSQRVTMTWPQVFQPPGGLQPGAPIFFKLPVCAGGMTLPSFVIVETVVDPNTVTFLVPQNAPSTTTGGGSTPLFCVKNGSTIVNVVQPGHGQQVGNTYNIPYATTVGASGVTLSGNYTVTQVVSPAIFQIVIPSPATKNWVAMENSGRVAAATQAAGVDYIDVLVWPISRDDFAMIPDKVALGRPTNFWFNRTIVPSVSLWLVPPQTPPYYGFVAYRMRELQDADPVNGYGPDMPRRFFPAFVDMVTARLAEIYRPEVFQAKMALAEITFDRAAAEDREKVTTAIVPAFDAYYMR